MSLDIPLGTFDEDGQPESSLVLTRGDLAIKVIPTGENQRKVYFALDARMKADGLISFSKKEINLLARGVIARERVPETLNGLRKSGWLAERDGRWEFVP